MKTEVKAGEIAEEIVVPTTEPQSTDVDNLNVAEIATQKVVPFTLADAKNLGKIVVKPFNDGELFHEMNGGFIKFCLKQTVMKKVSASGFSGKPFTKTAFYKVPAEQVALYTSLFKDGTDFNAIETSIFGREPVTIVNNYSTNPKTPNQKGFEVQGTMRYSDGMLAPLGSVDRVGYYVPYLNDKGAEQQMFVEDGSAVGAKVGGDVKTLAEGIMF